MNIFAGISDEDQDMFDYTTVSHGLYIGGRWQPSSEGRVIEVIDPSTEAVIATVPDATLADAASAVDAAAKAAAGWRETPPRRRSEILRRCFELMTERA